MPRIQNIYCIYSNYTFEHIVLCVSEITSHILGKLFYTVQNNVCAFWETNRILLCSRLGEWRPRDMFRICICRITSSKHNVKKVNKA